MLKFPLAEEHQKGGVPLRVSEVRYFAGVDRRCRRCLCASSQREEDEKNKLFVLFHQTGGSRARECCLPLRGR